MMYTKKICRYPVILLNNGLFKKKIEFFLKIEQKLELLNSTHKYQHIF